MKQLITIALIILSFYSDAQQKYKPDGEPIPYGPQPEVGKPMPDFTLNNITYYKTKRVSLKDFKGKWLFLDFWFSHCAACIQSFSKVNDLHKQFRNELNWIMVGLNDVKTNKGIQTLYEKFRAKQKLEMPSAYDSILADKWGIHSMPHIIIIDPLGIVRFISGGQDITAQKIRDLVNGKNVSFYPKDRERTEFDAKKLMNTTNNNEADDKLLYRSILTKWFGNERQMAGYELDRYVKLPPQYWKDGWSAAMVPLYALYNFAYLGKWDWDYTDTLLTGKYLPRPVLEIKDSSLFQFDYTVDVGKGTYNYNLTIPASEVTKNNLMSLMQKDLKTVFKYEVSIESRVTPVWKLVANPGAIERLKTKGNKKFTTPGTHAAGFTLTNWPSEILIEELGFYLKERYRGELFVDDTGLTGNIDFTIEADMTNLEDIRKELQRQGMDLVKGEKVMKALIIRDPKN